MLRAESARYSEVHGSPQNCGSSVQNLLHATFLSPRILRRLLDLWRIFRLVVQTSLAGHLVAYS